MLEIKKMDDKGVSDFLESGEPTTLEFLKENISEGFDQSLSGLAVDQFQEGMASGNDPAAIRESMINSPSGISRRQVDPELKILKSEEEYKASPFYREGIKFESGWSESRAKFMAEGFDERKERESVLQAGNKDGMVSARGAVGFVGQMIGGLADPINFIPFGAGIKGAGAAARIGSAVVEGAVGNLAVSGLTRPYYEDRGIDSNWQDYVMDTFVGGALGGTFGAAGHALESAKLRREKLTLADKQKMAQATDSTIKNTLEGEPIDLTEFNDQINKLYDISDKERAELIEVKRTEIETLTGISPEEANVAATLHVANSVVMSKHLGISPSEYLNSNYGADFQRADLVNGKIEALPQNQVDLDRLIDAEVQTMLSEVQMATKEGGGKVWEEGQVANTVADVSTYPEWYGSIGAKNQDDFAALVKNKDRQGYQRIREIAEERLREGYNSKLSGPMEPSAEYRALTEQGQMREIPVNETGEPLFKKSKGKERGAIQFAEDKKAVISLLKDTNESTILHESAHLFLKNYQRLIADGKAPQAILDDMKILTDWARTQKGDSKLDADTNFHEKVARGFEQYLREGKAPDPGLQGIFDRMREWLTSIYKNASDLKVEISPQARRVFDRMIALEPRPDLKPAKPIDVPPVRTIEDLEASISSLSDDAVINSPLVSPEERAEFTEMMASLNKEEAELQTLFQGAETNLDEAGQPIDPLIDNFNKSLEAQEAARLRLIEIAADKKELKRQAYLNLDARERTLKKVNSLISKGVDPEEAILSIFEGGSHLRGLEGSGNSLDGRMNAIGETMSAKTFAKLREIDPRIEKLFMDDPQFNENVLLEMLYLGKESDPARKIDPTAQKAAKVIADMKEELRQRANLAGANIGKLDGHITRFHDYEKMVGKGRKELWVKYIRDNIDLEKSFKGLEGAELEDAIDFTYENMTSNEWLGREHGKFDPVDPLPNRPRNIAKKMEAERTLHFKTPEAELAYLKEFGQGRNALGMAVRDLQNYSRKIAIMETLGTQPEANLASLYSNLRQELRQRTDLDPEVRNKMIESLNFQSAKNREGPVGHALMLAMGEGSSFANPRLKYFGSMIRLFNSVSKLGAATLSQFTDFAQIKNEARLVTGENQASAWVEVMQDYFKRVSPELKEKVLDHIATLGDGMNYANFNRFDQDNVNNWVGRMSDKMFKWSGQNWHTSKGKSAMALLITKELGKNIDKSWNDLAPNFKGMLSQYGSFNAERWDMLKNVAAVEVDGVKYYHPGLISQIDNSKFEAFIPDEFKEPNRPEVQSELDGSISELDQARIDSWEKSRASHLRREKYRLETDLQTFFLEESRNGMLEPDARVRRLSTFGTKSGTGVGEAARLMMQFKSFTVAYTDRIMGGKRFDASSTTIDQSKGVLGRWGDSLRGDPSGAIQHVVASVGLAYMSMVAKDWSKGLEHKDPTLAATWMMAGFQSGGLGIMGDFIQNAVSSRSNADIIAATAGPTVGLASNVLGVLGRTAREAGKGVRSRAGEKPNYEGLAEDYVHLARSNMPFGSLWYTRAAVNYLVWDRLKEALEPGSIRRSERRLKKEYNQKSLSMSTFGF